MLASSFEGERATPRLGEGGGSFAGGGEALPSFSKEDGLQERALTRDPKASDRSASILEVFRQTFTPSQISPRDENLPFTVALV